MDGQSPTSDDDSHKDLEVTDVEKQRPKEGGGGGMREEGVRRCVCE